MATYEYKNLKEKYGEFEGMVVVIKIDDKDLGDPKKGFPVSDLYVDLTSGYEASIAEFTIYDSYDVSTSSFSSNSQLTKYTKLGSKVQIATGYGTNATVIFQGAIMRVNYYFNDNDIPGVRITAMDVKGIMMSSTYSRQLTATSYSDAVKEILEKSVYTTMQSKGIIESINVSDTPDKQSSGVGSVYGDEATDSIGSISGTSGLSGENKETDRTIEMVAESDYEFIVKAAKRYNYEFFTECGNVYFRKAKSDATTRMVITPNTGMYNFDVSYDITGLVNKVTVRATDAAKAQVIEAAQKNQGNLPSKAKSLIKGNEKVYVDASVTSKEEAEYRAQSLMESVSYRFGSLECEMQGMPEYLPGYFFELSGLGDGIDNVFYINRVVHRVTTQGKYLVKLEGKAAETKE